MTAPQIVSNTLKMLVSEAKSGVMLTDLDKMAGEFIIKNGGTSANKGYQPNEWKIPFPAYTCISVNDEIAHAIPSPRKLEDGDLVSFDLGVKKDGLCGDAALTVAIGELSSRDERLLRFARRALYVGINRVRPGVTPRELGSAIELYASTMGFVTNITLCGHGIGKEMHEDPKIVHADLEESDTTPLKAGQMICLEPMLTYKDRFGVFQEDGWTLKTQDGRKSAFFEHQILVTKDGHQVLTDHIPYEPEFADL